MKKLLLTSEERKKLSTKEMITLSKLYDIELVEYKDELEQITYKVPEFVNFGNLMKVYA